MQTSRLDPIRFLVALSLFAFLMLPQMARAAEPGRKLALLVGVRTYDHADLPDLEFAENDVIDLERVLQTHGFKVASLTSASGKADARRSPTVKNINSALEDLLKGVTKRDLILVGFAGHGIQPLGSDRAYFCPQGGNPTTRAGTDKEAPNVAAFPETLISIDDLLERLRASGIGQKLLLVDACRNDPGVRGRRGVDQVRVQALPPETVVLLSCSPGQFAFEHKSWGEGGKGHGAFFSQVIAAMGGVAADERGQVTWDDLARHLRKRVPVLVKEVYGKEGAEQRPNIIANFSAEPIVLCTVSPRTAISTTKTTEPVTNSVQTVRTVPAQPAPGRMAGVWEGVYSYPTGDTRPGVRFNVRFRQGGALLTGSGGEANTFWENDSTVDKNEPYLYAGYDGRIDEDSGRLTFTKKYDGTANVSHGVFYTGYLNREGTQIEGKWVIRKPGKADFSGTFVLKRSAGK